LEVDDEIKAEITETKILFPEDVFEDALDQIMILAKNENIT